MSRVDEAMRRARAASEATAGADTNVLPAPGVDPADLPHEPFPLELPDRDLASVAPTPPLATPADPVDPADAVTLRMPAADVQLRPPSFADLADLAVRSPSSGDVADLTARLRTVDVPDLNVRPPSSQEAAPPAEPGGRQEGTEAERRGGAEAERSGLRTDAMPAVAPRPASLFERLDAGLARKVVVDENIMPVSREQYRRLAAALHNGQATSGLKVVMIASAVAGEGKTLTASNLALTLSESYRRRVLLIDADLRKPALHQIFKLNGSFGLTEGLRALEDRKLPVHAVSPYLTILPAGRADADPMAGLTSPRMQQLISEAREAFDWVIIDTPPVGLLTDANLLASMVDGTLLVVRAGSTPYDLVQRAVEAIGGTERMIGVVLNLAETDARSYKYGYQYYEKSPAPTLN